MAKDPVPLSLAIDLQVEQAKAQETKEALEGLKKADPKELVARLKALIADVEPPPPAMTKPIQYLGPPSQGWDRNRGR